MEAATLMSETQQRCRFVNPPPLRVSSCSQKFNVALSKFHRNAGRVQAHMRMHDDAQMKSLRLSRGYFDFLASKYDQKTYLDIVWQSRVVEQCKRDLQRRQIFTSRARYLEEFASVAEGDD
jgi:hypothetical protein